MSIKNSIGWTDMTLNPIKGRCPGGCWYCYYSGKRGMLNRLKHDPKIRLELSAFNRLPKRPKRVFLCSTHDLFGEWIKRGWRDLIFRAIEDNPRHTFQILTKFPQNIDRPMPDNVWLGVTVTQEKLEEVYRIYELKKAQARIKFISFEPLFSGFHYNFSDSDIDWIIIGRLTQNGQKYDPPREWIRQLVLRANAFKCKIFMKDNLREIWGKPLIQEFPEGYNNEK
jgi:protein gp37